MILVLLLGARYGIVAGLSTAAVGSVALLTWVRPTAQFQVWDMPGEVAKLIVLLFLGGALFGWLRSQHLEVSRTLLREVWSNNRQITMLTDKLAMLEDINRQLEIQTLSRVDTFARLYTISRTLAEDEVGTICERIPQLVSKHLQAERCSIYMLEDDVLQLKSSYGWDENFDYPTSLPVDRGLIGIACKEKRVVSIREFLNSPEKLATAGTSVLCAPMLDDHGQLIGAINIESMPFLSMNQSQVTIFDTLTKWVAQAIEQAAYMERVRKHTVMDTLLDLYTRDFLIKRMGEEVHRAHTHNLPLSLALLQLDPLPDQSPRSRIEELRIISAYLRRAVREIDIVTRYSEEMPIAILMTTTEIDEAEALVMRCQEDLEFIIPLGSNGKPRLRFGLADFSDERDTSAAMLSAAEESLGERT